MGTQTRKASERAMQRLQVDIEDRETLLPCPACNGEYRHLVETPMGSYKTRTCRWCNMGMVDKRITGLFTRWLRIYNANRAKGLCPLRKGG